MNYFDYLKGELAAVLARLAEEGDLPAGLEVERVNFEPPRDPAHGDVATNAAMVLAKAARMSPRELAERITPALLALAAVEQAEVAGPGFINLRLAPAFWQARLEDILRAGAAYGRANLGQGEKVNVEFVSANPTGPMHVGHGRGAVVGDVLATLLDAMGYDVTREYYINDAGAQVESLARSVYARYLEALDGAFGEDDFVALFPGKAWEYRGDYLEPVGKALADDRGDELKGQPEAQWLEDVRKVAVEEMMALIRQDLAALGVEMDVYSSERALVDAGGVDAVMAELERSGQVYQGVLEPPKGKTPEDWEPRQQTLFRATAFGDDVDRPIRKSDGSWTYFAGDIAYHLDKFRRGFANMIDVWGADHSGYVKRMQAAVKAVTDGRGSLDVKLCQLVNLMERGEPVRMSKRAGSYVTLREVVDQVGKDVVRFIMLIRSNDAPLDFDLAKVTEHSRDNPVWYVQYAHARTRSVLRQAADLAPAVDRRDAALATASFARLDDPDELGLMRMLAGWPAVLAGAARTHEPHRLAFYLGELAATFHALWTKGKGEPRLRFIVEGDDALTAARLALVRATGFVIASGLGIFGVTPVEELQ